MKSIKEYMEGFEDDIAQDSYEVKSACDMLIEHIPSEYGSGLLYINISSFCHSKGYTNLEDYFKVRGEEEFGHGMKFIEMATSLGYTPCVSNVSVECSPTDLISVGQAFLAHEQLVTSQIKAILEAAKAEGNDKLIEFLIDFMGEQVKEENEARIFLTQVSAFTTEAEFMQYDQAFQTYSSADTDID